MTVQGPVKEQQPDGMSQRGGAFYLRRVGLWLSLDRFGMENAHDAQGPQQNFALAWVCPIPLFSTPLTPAHQQLWESGRD